MTSKLFSPIKLRELTLKNRIVVSPMCMYSATDGVPNDWHLVHLGSRAVGGAGVVMVEATGVVPEGRISIGCLALCNQQQADAFKPITKFIKAQGSIPAIQLAHSGRKGSFDNPFNSPNFLTPEAGGWEVVAPSARAFSDRYPVPKELSHQEINDLLESFKHSALLALEAGFEIIEGHSAHGYLMHQFLSPLSNFRQDEFGGSLENRMRFPLMVARVLRETWPAHLPVFMRISATDWSEGGWSLEDSIVYAQELKKIGIDLIDVSTGGNLPGAKIPVAPDYQVPFAAEIKKQSQIATSAVGLITDAHQAEAILQDGHADLVMLARELLRDPYWPINAARELGDQIDVPAQYARAYS